MTATPDPDEADQTATATEFGLHAADLSYSFSYQRIGLPTPAVFAMRTAPQPWGPWSAPQTIFNAKTDGHCVVIDNINDPAPYNGKAGGAHGPYFVQGWTAGIPPTKQAAATSSFSYTVSTFDPYGQVIERSTIGGWSPR